MSLYSIISGIVDQLVIEGTSDKPDFKEGWKQFQNLIDDEQLTEVVYLDWPINNSSVMAQYTNKVKETYTVSLIFLQKSELDYTADQHRPILDRQRRQANKFLSLISQSEELESIGNITAQEVINVFNSNKTGISLNLTITPYPNVPTC